MLSKWIYASLMIFLSSCVSYDSVDFEPTPTELEAAKHVEQLKDVDPIKGTCKKLGEIKISQLAAASGQPAPVVAVRKYKTANLIKHTGYRTDGGMFGEAPFHFHDVYHCDK